MICTDPRKAVYSKELTKKGKRKLVFAPRDALADAQLTVLDVELPCGQCINCRLARAREWSVRIMHEAHMHDSNEFVTLTYDDDHLPKHNNLNYVDVQLFFKRLRRKYGNGIKHFTCGEYGERFQRPHYHSAIFNISLPDKKPYKKQNGFQTYTSAVLNDLWGHGFCVIGDLTFESANYIARYVTKKIVGVDAKNHYSFCDIESREELSFTPEFARMSNRPAIGFSFFDNYLSDIYPCDYVISRGHRLRPPSYYDRKLEELDPVLFESLKRKRRLLTKDRNAELTDARLRELEKFAYLKFKNNYIRSLDNDI